MNKPAIIVITIFVLASGILAWSIRNRNKQILQTQITSVTTSPSVFLSSSPIKSVSPAASPAETIIAQPTFTAPAVPKTYNIDNVPYIVQAPFANWDELHEEACEEASILMANGFLSGINSISKEDAENQIQDLVKWERENGYGVDVNVKQVSEILQKKFSRKDFEILQNPTLDDFKNHLSQNHLIIVPAAGRLLENPYYTAPGPAYHMLVARGYTEKEIITNDPGTRRGENYRYPFGTFFNAIHDWTGDKETINTGTKKILVIEK